MIIRIFATVITLSMLGQAKLAIANRYTRSNSSAWETRIEQPSGRLPPGSRTIRLEHPKVRAPEGSALRTEGSGSPNIPVTCNQQNASSPACYSATQQSRPVTH
jgi:hypothetical protein